MVECSNGAALCLEAQHIRAHQGELCPLPPWRQSNQLTGEAEAIASHSVATIASRGSVAAIHLAGERSCPDTRVGPAQPTVLVCQCSTGSPIPIRRCVPQALALVGRTQRADAFSEDVIQGVELGEFRLHGLHGRLADVQARL